MSDFALSHPEASNVSVINTKETDPALAKAAVDEPIFVLRAQDKDAPVTVLKWVEFARAAGVPVNRLVRAQQIAHQMIDWQLRNGAKHVD